MERDEHEGAVNFTSTEIADMRTDDVLQVAREEHPPENLQTVVATANEDATETEHSQVQAPHDSTEDSSAGETSLQPAEIEYEEVPTSAETTSEEKQSEMKDVAKPDLSVVRLIEKAENSAGKLVNLLAKHFPCFRDETRFDGKRVRFLKRAQIFVADLWAAFNGTSFGAFNDIDHLTMFAGMLLSTCHLGCTWR